jgi:hypothetical protein
VEYHLTQDNLLKRLFNRMDTDNDGYVSKKELALSLRKDATLRESLGVALNLAGVDSNEVYRRIAAVRDPNVQRQLPSAGLSFDEFSRYIQGMTGPPDPVPPPPPETAAALSSKGRNLFLGVMGGGGSPSKKKVPSTGLFSRTKRGLGFAL